MPLASTVPLRFAAVSVMESATPVTATGASGTGVWAPAAAGMAAASTMRITKKTGHDYQQHGTAPEVPLRALALG